MSRDQLIRELALGGTALIAAVAVFAVLITVFDLKIDVLRTAAGAVPALLVYGAFVIYRRKHWD